jgi:hypothetical protein
MVSVSKAVEFETKKHHARSSSLTNQGQHERQPKMKKEGQQDEGLKLRSGSGCLGADSRLNGRILRQIRANGPGYGGG